MRCTPIKMGNGAAAIVCTSGDRRKPCATPGCRGRADLVCDHPVERRDEAKRGDSRLHKEHKLLFFVWSVNGDTVTISQQDPATTFRPGITQTVPIADWLAKADATCDRPVCSRCAVRVGDLDLCGVHARALEGRAG
jgi:hypothetical protein